MRNNRDLIQKLEEIEQELRTLRLTLTERESGASATTDTENQRTDQYRVGEYVKVNSPNFVLGQERIAKVIKYNPRTGYYSLVGKRFGKSSVRKWNGLSKLE